MPHPPVYHFQDAPKPLLPPLVYSFPLALRQTLSTLAKMDAAALEVSRTVIFTIRQMVLLQIPSARTLYALIPGVVGATVAEVPVANEVPPQLPSYHFQLAPAPRKPPDNDTPVD